MNEHRHLESLRKKLTKVAPAGDLESLAHDPLPAATTEATLESLPSTTDVGVMLDHRVTTSAERSAETRESALRKLANGDFDDVSSRERLELEAIVEEEGRPVSFIEGDRFEDLPHPWTHFNDRELPIRRKIEEAIPLIGRVEVPSSFHGEGPKHLGTGFIVGRNLMMTNRHVAELFVRGVGRSRLSFVPGVSTAIDFRREKGFSPSDRTSSADIVDIVMVHPYWDMALLRIDGTLGASPGLALSVLSPEELNDREIAVIGYPGRSRDRSPKAVELERKYFGTLFGVKRLAPGEIRERERIESFDHLVSAMVHDSSTLPGNSGAAILDVATGAIVGLHFAGITLRANYSVPMFELARDRRVVDAGVHFTGSVPPTDQWENVWTATEPSHELAPVATHGGNVTHGVGPLLGNATVTLSFPLTLTVSPSDPGPTPTGAPSSTAPRSGPSDFGIVEASFQVPVIHPNLEQRHGYDPGFLELDDDQQVPLPTLTPAGQLAVSRLDDGTFELKYHRFSVVVHKKRRLALFTAANVNWQMADRLINGHKPTREELTGIPDGVLEEWVTDPRIPEKDQLPDVFFTKDQGAFDKGHLVRRDDVAWGSSFAEMQKGNGDTYHTTNCSPQVGKFNQSHRGVDNWGDLENMIQKQTSAERVIIISGPVLSPSDRIFKGVDESGLVKIQVPKKFWKIVVANTDEGPRAFGFVLKQKLTDVPLEFAVPEDWEPFQTPIPEIEELTFGLTDLAWFKQRDVLNE